jgi:hypothetical protein
VLPLQNTVRPERRRSRTRGVNLRNSVLHTVRPEMLPPQNTMRFERRRSRTRGVNLASVELNTCTRGVATPGTVRPKQCRSIHGVWTFATPSSTRCAPRCCHLRTRCASNIVAPEHGCGPSQRRPPHGALRDVATSEHDALRTSSLQNTGVYFRVIALDTSSPEVSPLQSTVRPERRSSRSRCVRQGNRSVARSTTANLPVRPTSTVASGCKPARRAVGCEATPLPLLPATERCAYQEPRSTRRTMVYGASTPAGPLLPGSRHALSASARGALRTAVASESLTPQPDDAAPLRCPLAVASKGAW